jgi:hypothetical protein
MWRGNVSATTANGRPGAGHRTETIHHNEKPTSATNGICQTTSGFAGGMPQIVRRHRAGPRCGEGDLARQESDDTDIGQRQMSEHWLR